MPSDVEIMALSKDQLVKRLIEEVAGPVVLSPCAEKLRAAVLSRMERPIRESGWGGHVSSNPA